MKGARHAPTGGDGVPSNWGRWGDEDERGTANLLNAGLVREAARLIQSGTVYSLAAPLSPDGPNLPNRRPTWYVVTTRRPDGVLSSADHPAVEVVRST